MSSGTVVQRPGITINIGGPAKRLRPDLNPRSFQPTKVYIGGISQKYEEPELRDLAKSYGRPLSFFYMEDCSGCDAGWMLVTYECLADANSAIAGFKNTDKFETRLSSSQNFAGGRRQWRAGKDDEEEDKPAAAIPCENPKTDSGEEPEHLPSIIAMAQAQASAQANAQAVTQTVAQLQQKQAAAAGAVKAPGNKPEDVPKWENWREYSTKEGDKYYYNVATQQTTWEKPAGAMFRSGPPLPPPQPQGQVMMQPKTLGMPTMQPQMVVPQVQLPPGAGQIGDQMGPTGANLFVYNYPLSWTEQDVFQHFVSFGTIIQVKIQRDMAGNSRGFGFISYDKPASAIQAIHAMNNFEVEGKMLNVSIKKGEEDSLLQNAVMAK